MPLVSWPETGRRTGCFLRNLKEPYPLQNPKANDKRYSTDRKPQLSYYLATSKSPGHEGNPPRRIPEKLL